MAPVLVTLNDLEGHSPVAGVFKCNLSNICAAFYQISTDSVLLRPHSDSSASCHYYMFITARLSLVLIREMDNFVIHISIPYMLLILLNVS